MKKTILFGLSIFLFWSCNNSSSKTTTHQQDEIHETHHHDESLQVIELNNGEKWVVNSEMKPFVSKGAELVNVYVQENKTDFKELTTQLKEQNNQLIKSCTMKGKSHDELHKWLYPHLELVKELDNETDAVKAKEIVVKLQNSYQQYQIYFN
ncbi:hypothetical protein JSO59_010765 [Riemerella anatipestifer]|uniref:hypothetical protein n=1 Tax=Riemerella anatipestifer TaxID=34085 RepID=UPI0030BB3529